MSLAAIITDNIVENTIMYDSETEWSPPEGSTLVVLSENDFVDIGWSYDGTNFHAPPPPPGLISDKSQITANTTDLATVTYRHDPVDSTPNSVTFTVNGVTQVVNLVDLSAVIGVTAAAPGPIDVSVDTLPEFTLLITGV